MNCFFFRYLFFVSLIFSASAMLVSCAGNRSGDISCSCQAAQNAAYSGIFEHPVTLKHGQWEGEPFVKGGASRPRAGLVENLCFTGDLDDDGDDELAVILWENSGGSGTFSYLAVLDMREEGCANIATQVIGDRVKVEGGSISSGKIELDVVDAGPDDPACCPSRKRVITWRLRNGVLTREGK